jgi:hypothetical protein
MPWWVIAGIAYVLGLMYFHHAVAVAKMESDVPTIPDRDFEALLRYVKEEIALDQLEKRLRLFPETEGLAVALAHIEILRKENIEALFYKPAPK